MKFLKDTNTKLQQARDDLAACEQLIEGLKADRLQKLLDVEPFELERIDRDLDARQRQAGIFQERIQALESKLAGEAVDKRKADYQAHVAKIEKAIGDRHAAAQEVEGAIRSLVAASTKLCDVSARVSQWPADIDRPPWFGNFGATNQIGELIKSCFSVPSRPYSPTLPTTREYADRLYSATERAAGFAEALRESDQAIIAGLRGGTSTEEAA